LPRRKYQYTSQVIVIPGHLFFREEADDLCFKRVRRGVYEQEVIEARDIEEDRFIIQEELCEEGKVLAKELFVNTSARYPKYD
jgi:hypothetical protein